MEDRSVVQLMELPNPSSATRKFRVRFLAMESGPNGAFVQTAVKVHKIERSSSTLKRSMVDHSVILTVAKSNMPPATPMLNARTAWAAGLRGAIVLSNVASVNVLESTALILIMKMVEKRALTLMANWKLIVAILTLAFPKTAKDNGAFGMTVLTLVESLGHTDVCSTLASTRTMEVWSVLRKTKTWRKSLATRILLVQLTVLDNGPRGLNAPQPVAKVL